MEAHCAKQPFFQMARQVAGKIEASRAVRLASFAFLPIIHSAMALQHLKRSLCTPGHQILAESDHRPEPKSTASGAQSPEGEASEGEDWSCWGRRGTGCSSWSCSHGSSRPAAWGWDLPWPPSGP